jgi:mannan endo-1,4-beta-mannosidase
MTQYRSLFNDAKAEIGKKYYYRIKSQNDSGISEPSNLSGPVLVKYLTLIDELKDFSVIYQHQGDLTIENKLARQAKEDNHRLKGRKDSFIIYKLPGSIKSGAIYSFFPNEIADIKLSLSTGGNIFREISPEKQNYFTDEGDYDYWKPVKYKFSASSNETFLKLEFMTDIQISRIEINHE